VVAVGDGLLDRDAVAGGAVGPTDSADGTAANDCDETDDAGGRVDDGAPACTLDDDATDDAFNEPSDAPDEPDDLALLEQPASIPSTARLTPARRRPRISLL
jgi:hypothetical protein